MVNRLRWSLSILSSVAFLAGFLVSSTSATLRAGNIDDSSFAEESTIIPDSDLVDGSSYLVIQLDGYDMSDLRRISPKKQAIIECAFHKAFNEVHGDRDGLYLSGQQIVASDKSNKDDDNDDDTGSNRGSFEEGIELYQHRPRKFPPKDRDRPSDPPPNEDHDHSYDDAWDIYWHSDFTGMCNLCYVDDDWYPTEGDYESLPRDNENLQLASRHEREQRVASEHVASEASVNAIADALRKHLIEGSCVEEEDHSFEYIRKTDIYVLSRSDFEESVAAIAASIEVVKDDATDLAALPAPLPAVLPYFYGESVPENLGAAGTGGDGFGEFKIGLWGVDCGPWNNEDLLDLNSALHDAINSIGLTDRGHVMDKIVPRKRSQPRFRRKYDWKCHFDVYVRLGLDRIVPKDYVLTDVGDGLCDRLGRFGWKNKFRNVIDCRVDPVAETDYRSVVVAISGGEEKAGVPAVSSARRG